MDSLPSRQLDVNVGGDSTQQDARTHTARHAKGDIQRAVLTLEQGAHEAALGKGVGAVSRRGQSEAATVDGAIHTGVEVEGSILVLVLQKLNICSCKEVTMIFVPGVKPDTVKLIVLCSL